MVWQPSYDTAAALLRNLGKQDATTKQNRKSPLREEACGETLLPRFKATGEPTVAQAQTRGAESFSPNPSIEEMILDRSPPRVSSHSCPE